GAVGSGLAAEARGVGRVAQWQAAAVEDLAAMQVGQRHFSGRNQIQIPLTRDLEEILLELRQIAGPAQRLAVDEKRRLDLAISVLARVEVEHEVDERPRQARARSAQHGEA